MIQEDKSAATSHSSDAFSQQATQAQASASIRAIPETLGEYRCPTCSARYATLGELREHVGADHPDTVLPETIVLHINGRDCQVLVEPHWTLQRTLQFRLGLTGTKHMCDRGACGSCTIIMDGRAVLACTTLAVECAGCDIITIEGIAADEKWKPLVDAYCRWDAMQCGYCTPGFLVTAKNLLDKNPHPTEAEINEALAGNICICGTYPRHGTAILEAALKMSEDR